MTRGTGPLVVISRHGREVAHFTLLAAGPTTLAVVDELARLQLVARRRGYEIAVRQPCDALTGLIALCGLEPLLLEVGRQAEGGEQVGVEEVVMTDDAPP